MTLCYKILIPLLIISLLALSCSGRSLVLYQPQHQYKSSFNTNNPPSNKEIDKEFKIKQFNKETINDKIGYVVLGLVIAGVTASAIALPLILLNK